jgi:hypothetical protein
MPYAPMPVRLVDVVAYQPSLTAMWDGDCSTISGNPSRLHVARHPVGRPDPGRPARAATFPS